MDLFWVLYAASCFFFYAIGRMHGLKVGTEAGKKYMKMLVDLDIKRYPTKWQHYLDKARKNDRR